jgi:mediator of RNA polymerase II transcription subunit 14
LKSLQDLNTLLSIRLNLHEYDKILSQFKNYTIRSGRVTFKVPGEFEVDLTIADEDPEKQFWFIDFRFLFTPTTLEIPENLRYGIGTRVNLVLQRDGLVGCYKFLHELVLTHKINEIRRQAIELSRGKWIETLQVEPLHRALSIQYWLDRYGKDGLRSWIILGVDSGKRKDGLLDPKATSRISLRWFRDSKEVKDHGITLDLTTLSAESLLQGVISKHIFYILGSMYKNLVTKPLFSNKQLSISFKVSETDPKDPELRVQLTRQENINITIEARTGYFAISPALRLATRTQINLNSLTKDPAPVAHEFIEKLRCVAVSAEIINRARSVGWEHVENSGLKPEDLKPIMPRDTLQLSWFRRAGWSQGWFIALSASMSGERWWLMEL